MADLTDTPTDDKWLISVFARAAGPFVDSAFAERILTRLRHRSRTRLYVIAGASVIAAALTLGLASIVFPTTPTFNLAVLKGPDWMALSSSTLAASGVLIAVLAIWMVADET